MWSGKVLTGMLLPGWVVVNLGTAMAEPLPTPEEVERSGAVIGEITFSRGDVFDTDLAAEDRRLFRLANRLHRTTRTGVVEDLLLFEPGDRFVARRIDESERLLRASRYFYDPEIRIVRVADGRVDLEVVTQDLWGLKGGVGAGRSGGANSTHFQVKDSNLLGTGAALNLERTSDVDRSSSLLEYRDPNLLGSRVVLEVGHATNSDGSRSSFQLERPFYSFDSRWAAGASAVADDRVDSQYQLGQVSGTFRVGLERLELYGGLARHGDLDAPGRAGPRVSRLTAGFTFERQRFEIAANQPAPAPLPLDRTLAYPWVAFDSVGDEFLETRNFDQLSRTEDLPLGWRFHARLGASATAFGADRNEAVFEVATNWGAQPNRQPMRALQLSATASGRYGEDGARNVQFGGHVRYSRRNFGTQLFLASLTVNATDRLDPERQLLLGGDSGLRGYPLRYQEGDGNALLSIEQRFFTDWYPFRLVHVGAAIFFDAGQAWSKDGAEKERLRGLLRNVGLGLRLGNSRSTHGSTVHFDIAFPLDGDGSIDRVQYLVTSRSGF
jgi:outer membrane protein assembly factor BamA